jgi:hypothetical protein
VLHVWFLRCVVQSVVEVGAQRPCHVDPVCC